LYSNGQSFITKLDSQAQGTWFTGAATVQSDVSSTMSAAAAQGNTVPILIAYNIPNRDCGGYSSGGAANDGAYQQWITAFAQGIGQAKAAVILEPDAVSQMDAGCLSSSQISDRQSLLTWAVQTFQSIAPNAAVYIDAGHGADGIPAATMAQQLMASGVANAAGFALNVANYVSTADNTSYGQQISSLANNKHFIIDTSRNGTATANGVWCNPPNQGAGTPSVGFSNGVIDGYLWVQNPGTSDGACGGMSYAGQFDLQQACSLAANATF
jgi:endoglucanase